MPRKKKEISNPTPNHLRIDWQQFIAWFNTTRTYYDSAVPELKFVRQGKQSQIQRIVNEAGTKTVLIDAVVAMMKSDVCNGRKRSSSFPNGWVASFPWMLSNDDIIFDLANGKYDNAPPVQLTAEEQRQLERERYAAEQEKRRAEARRIEEEERERRQRQREYDEAHKATPEELKAILAGFKLPKLTAKQQEYLNKRK